VKFSSQEASSLRNVENQSIAQAVTSRKMATIRVIDEIRPHTNADALELAIIGGWQCVVKKGDFHAGELVVYFEIDSWIPHDIAPFLSKGHEPREYEGVKGERLKTIKLRKELSQGLVMPVMIIPEDKAENIPWSARNWLENGVAQYEGPDGFDVSEILNVKKWERPLAANMRGNALRYFPGFIRKTDQERIQNRLRTLEGRDPEEEFEVSLKIDGSSTTFYVMGDENGEGHTGVCSRNLELKTDESNAGNLFVDMYHKLDIPKKLKDFHDQYGRNIAIQGELYGTGINGNWEGIQDVRFAVFDVFDCDRQRYLPADERFEIVRKLMLPHVHVLGYGTLEGFGLGSLKIEDFLAFADRPSIHNSVAEGVVFKSLTDPDFSFKVINNKFLLNGGE
jgi:RNA ligase, DRB0094 family